MREQKDLKIATLTDDGGITNDGFAENAVYHATCMTNYFLKRIKDDSEDYLTSEHDDLFQSFISTISTIKDDLFLNFCPLIERKVPHHTYYNRN
jgi:hypothetical protein